MVGRFIKHILKCFQPWKPVKGAIHFIGVKMLAIKFKPFTARQVIWIKNLFPVGTVKAGAANMYFSFHSYNFWQLVQKKLLRFFTPVCFLVNGKSHRRQVFLVCASQCALSSYFFFQSKNWKL
jgi:hypothetical protein